MQAHRVHTGCVQVVRQLYRRLHLYVGLEDAAAERCLVVGLLRLGLDAAHTMHTTCTPITLIAQKMHHDTVCILIRYTKQNVFRSFVLILTQNNGSELKTGQGGVEIISNNAWGISMTVHEATACLLCLCG